MFGQRGRLLRDVGFLLGERGRVGVDVLRARLEVAGDMCAEGGEGRDYGCAGFGCAGVGVGVGG